MSAELESLPRFWSPDPIIGVKFYRRQSNGDFGSLHGIVRANDEWYDASCHLTLCNAEGNAPIPLRSHGRCPFSCGWHAYKLNNEPEFIDAILFDQWKWQGIDSPMAVGLVELGGIVLEHEHGYKASKQRLIVDSFTNTPPFRPRKVWWWPFPRSNYKKAYRVVRDVIDLGLVVSKYTEGEKYGKHR